MSKMIKCKSCDTEIASSAKSCPKCGAKNKKPIYLRWWFILVVIFIVIGALGSIGGEKSNDNSASDSATHQSTEKEEKYIVSDLTESKDQYSEYIEGTLKNNSGKEASYVQVSFNLFDAEGNQIGTALANTNNLAKDGTWKFKALGTAQPDKVASYKLAEVTGF